MSHLLLREEKPRSRARFTPGRLFSTCALAAVAAVTLYPRDLHAQAFDGDIDSVSAGAASRSVAANSETITIDANRTIINWSANSTGTNPFTFLPAGNTATFEAGDIAGSYLVINRIFGGDGNDPRMDFLGNVTSDTAGRIWFYSPGGILVGSTAVFDVGSLLLTANDPVEIEEFGYGTGRYTFTASAGSTATVTNQGTIRTSNSYVAMIAPRVVQQGTVESAGSVAYVAAEQVTTDIDIAGSLFNISITVGSDADTPGGTTLEHSGTTELAPADSVARQVIFAAVPKNDAITMLVSGNIGYATADEVTFENGTIILAAGYDAGGGSVGGSVGGTTATADIALGGGNYFVNSVEGRATGSAIATATPGAASPIVLTGSLTLEALDTAALVAEPNATIDIGGSLELNADDFVSGNAGTTRLEAGDGSSITIGGTATLSADAGIFLDVLPDVGADTQGGQSSVIVGQGASVTIAGDLEVTATAEGQFGVTGGGGFGGTASISINGGALTAGDILVDTTGIGAFDFGGTDGNGGGTGGTSTVEVLDGGALTLISDGVPQDLEVFANGGADPNDVESTPNGPGQGGTASVIVRNSTVSLDSIDVKATGEGGEGGAPEGDAPAFAGYDGTGGTATVELTSAGGDPIDFIEIDADGVGGDGGFGTVGGTGGTGTGGTATLIVGGNAPVITEFELEADGTGGTGGDSFESQNNVPGVGGIGGAGIGGSAIAEAAVGGTLTLDVFTIDIAGRGGTGGTGSSGVDAGAGGAGGSGTGGTAELRTTGGTIDIANVEGLFLEAPGIGGQGGTGGQSDGGVQGVGGAGGQGTGGTALLNVVGGAINSPFTFLDSPGFGGAGGLGEGGFDPAFDGADGGGAGGISRISVADGNGASGGASLGSVTLDSSGFDGGFAADTAGQLVIEDIGTVAGGLAMSDLLASTVGLASAAGPAFQLTSTEGTVDVTGTVTVDVDGDVSFDAAGSGGLSAGGAVNVFTPSSILLTHASPTADAATVSGASVFFSALTSVVGDAGSLIRSTGTDVEIFSDTIDIGRAEAARDLILDAGGAATIIIDVATAGEDIDLNSVGDIIVGTAQAGDDFVASTAGAFAGTSVTTTGLGTDAELDGSNIVVTSTGDLRLDNGSAVDTIDLASNTGSVLSDGTLDATLLLVGAALNIDLFDVFVVQTLNLSAPGGSIFGNSFNSDGSIFLTAADNIVLTGAASSGEDIELNATGITLASAQAGDDFRANAGDDFTATALATTGDGPDDDNDGLGDGTNIAVTAGGDIDVGSAIAGGTGTGGDFVVEALANSAVGGAPLASIEVIQGQPISVSSSTDDLWSAGPLPRFSDGDGLVAARFATATDDSGQPVGTQIGANFGLLTQFGLSAPFGALVGEVNGTFFLLGANSTVSAPATGTLNLRYWDSNAGDNLGNISFAVSSFTTPPQGVGFITMEAGGNLNVGTAIAGGDISLDSLGGITLASANSVGGEIELTAEGLVDVGTLQSGRSTNIESETGITVDSVTANLAGIPSDEIQGFSATTAGDLIVGTAVADNIGLGAFGSITAGSLTADNLVGIFADGAVNLGDVIAGGLFYVGNPSTAISGNIFDGGLSEAEVEEALLAAPAAPTGGGVTSTGAIDVGRAIILAGGDVSLGTLTALENIDLVSEGALSAGDVESIGGMVDLSAAGDMTLGNVRAAGSIFLTGGGLITALDLAAGTGPLLGGGTGGNGAGETTAGIAPGFDDFIFPRNDDGATGAITLPFLVSFFGTEYGETFVSNNGYITFNFGQGAFTPTGLGEDYSGQPIIAPFFADVDTRNAASAEMTYGTGMFAGRQAFGATWDGVGYFSSQADKLNNFQVILVDRSDTGSGNFDIFFNYTRIQWETGSASGGVNGFGGISAAVGYNGGTGNQPGTFFELPGSRVPGSFLDNGTMPLILGTNNGVPGQLRFQVRQGQVFMGMGDITVTNLAPGNTGSITLGNLSANNIDVQSANNLTLDSAAATTGEVDLFAVGNVLAGTLSSGTSTGIESLTGDVVVDTVSANLVDTPAGVIQGFGAIATSGNVTVGSASADNIGLAALGDVIAGDLVSDDLVVILAGGDTILDTVTGGGLFYIGNPQTLESLGGFADFDVDVFLAEFDPVELAALPFIPSGGDIVIGQAEAGLATLSAGGMLEFGTIVSASNAILLGQAGVAGDSVAATNDVTLGSTGGAVVVTTDLAAGGVVDAAGTSVSLNALGNLPVRNAVASDGNVMLNAGGLLSLSGNVDGNGIILESSDISVGTEAQVGSQAETTDGIRIVANGATVGLGGSGGGGGYSLDNNEFAAFSSGGNIDFVAATPQAALTLGTLDIGGTGASDANLLGTLTIESAGQIDVVGAVTMQGTTDANTLALRAPDGDIFVNAETGSISLTNGTALAGTLEMEARAITVATPAAVTELEGLATTDDRSRRLGRNDGAVNEGGYLQAADIVLAAQDHIWVQNSGASSLTADRRGLTVGPSTLTIVNTGEGQLEIIVNGRQEDGSGGFITGREFVSRVAIDGDFQSRSTINGCLILGGVCSSDNLAPTFVQDLLSGLFSDPDEDNPQAFNQPPTFRLSTLIELEGSLLAPAVDDPVTGSGNDDFFLGALARGGEAEDIGTAVTGAGREVAPEEEEDTPVTGAGRETEEEEDVDDPVTGTGREQCTEEERERGECEEEEEAPQP